LNSEIIRHVFARLKGQKALKQGLLQGLIEKQGLLQGLIEKQGSIIYNYNYMITVLNL